MRSTGPLPIVSGSGTVNGPGLRCSRAISLVNCRFGVKKKRCATLSDVAEAAGVSRTLASAILGGNPKTSVRYSAETRERVIQAAEELGYRTNLLAKNLSKRCSHAIGIMGALMNVRYYGELLAGLQGSLFARGYTPMLLVHDSAETERTNLARLQERMVDGLIVTSLGNHETYNELKSSALPLITIFDKSLPDVPSVNINRYETGSLGVQHLRERGHRRIALLTHHRYLANLDQTGACWDAFEQYKGYADAMREADEAEVVVPQALPTANSTDECWIAGATMAAEKLFDAKCTAVICYHDLQALTILKEARKRGIRVPRDLAVIGVENSSMCSLSSPSLTSFRFDAAELGRMAASAILDLLAGKPAESMEISPSLVVRESTSTPRSRRRPR